MINFLHLNKDTKRISFRKDITFLRFISVIAVLFYHADLEMFSGGWLGVDIFFVISGYLISNIIFSELFSKTFTLKNFFKRRIKRILPAMMSVLLITVPLSYFLLVPKELLEYARSLVSSLFLYSNYYFRNLDFYNSASAKKMPLLHMWTLSVEEQFYVIFPIVSVVIFYIFNKKSVFPFAIFFLFSLFLNSTNQTNDKFYFIEYRAWEFLVGVLVMFLSLTFKVKYIKFFGLSVIFYSFYFFDDSQLNQIEPKLLVILGTTLFLLFDNNLFLDKAINNKFMQLIGLSSFSIYLLHQPIFSFYRIYLERTAEYVSFFEKTILIVLSLLLGIFSYSYIEKYFMKSKNLFKLFVFIALTVVVTIFFFVYVENTDGIKHRYDFIPEEVLFYSLNTNFYPNSDNENLKYWNEFSCVGGTCNFSNKGNSHNIYLFGDSHANIFSVSMLRNFSEISQKYNLKVKNGTGGRCLLTGQVDSNEYVGACERSYFNEFIERISKDDYVVITGRLDLWLREDIGGSQLQCEDCNYLNEINERFSLLSQKSKNLIIFYPHPTYDFPIAKSYLYKQNEWGVPIKKSYNEWSEYIESTNLFFNNIKGENIIRVKSENYFCNNFENGYCYASTETELLYTDDNHLTFEGVGYLTKRLNEILLNIINKI